LPEVIVDQGSQSADRKSNSKPNRLPPDEEINISTAALRKRASAEKHYDADDK